jgi:prepilin peptidase CpaA
MMLSEMTAMLELLQMLVLSPRTGVLMALLLVAAVIDIKTGRIPNWLVFGGALYALVYNTMSPLYARDIGILFALGGLAVGLVSLLPAYLFRVMGAGDVKLMAMVGAFVGAWATVGAVLATLVAGGVLALALAMSSGRTVRLLRNVAAVSRGTIVTITTGIGGLAAVHDGQSAGKMPYGVAIAVGTIAYLVLSQLGFVGGAWL